jgi:hypothetical protein
MQQLRELFGNTIRAARILGIDKDLQAELVECTIRSLNGTPCTVRYGSETKELKLLKGESRNVFSN